MAKANINDQQWGLQTHTIEESYSALAVLQKVDTSGYKFHQCEEGQEVNRMKSQHWTGSKESHQDVLEQCIIQHYDEADLHPIPPGAGSTMLHQIVLTGQLVCKVCQAILNTEAYRFCLTLATPTHRVLGDSTSETGEWCCSLIHAKESALSIINSMHKGESHAN